MDGCLKEAQLSLSNQVWLCDLLFGKVKTSHSCTWQTGVEIKGNLLNEELTTITDHNIDGFLTGWLNDNSEITGRITDWLTDWVTDLMLLTD